MCETIQCLDSEKLFYQQKKKTMKDALTGNGNNGIEDVNSGITSASSSLGDSFRESGKFLIFLVATGLLYITYK